MIYKGKPEYAMEIIREGKGFRPFLDDTAQILGSEIKVVEEKNMKKELEKYSAVLVKEGYAACKGRSEREARVAMEVLEKACFSYIHGRSIGGVKPLSWLDARLMRAVYLKKYSKNEEGSSRATTGNEMERISEDERKTRELLVEYGNYLVSRGLVSGTWGNLSIRLDDRFMLVTPSGISYDRLTAGDMVKVDLKSGNYEGNLKPTSEKSLHSGIYQARPDVGAVIHTHQTYAGIYAACEKGMREIDLAEYGLPGTSKLAKNTVKGLGAKKGCIMAHHGICAVGADIEEAFKNCLWIEEMAKKSIGIKD